MYVAIEVARTFFAKAIHRDLVVSLHELLPSVYGIDISLKHGKGEITIVLSYQILDCSD
jgi:hypothetical protein